MPRKILLDCDPGHDDAVALLLAHGSPEIELLAVTTVAGNQTLEKVTRNALAVATVAGLEGTVVAAGCDRPLVTGAVLTDPETHGASGLDGPLLPEPAVPHDPRHGVDVIVETVLAAEPGTLTLVPTGPLTNIALYLEAHGTANMERIVLMGGAIAEGNMTPAAEFNIWADPEAAHRVFHSSIETTMIGLDVTHRALMYDEDAERLRGAGRVGRLVAELYDFFHLYHQRQYKLSGSPIHDAVAVAHVIRDDLVETKHRYVTVDTGPELSRGRTYVDIWERTDNEPNCHVGTDVDGRAFIEFLIERLASLG